MLDRTHLIVGAAGLVAGRSLGRRATRTPTHPGGAPALVRSQEVDGVLHRWEEHGPPDGPVVVLVHGIPTSPRLWRHVIPHLVRAGARCLAWELVGFGASGPEAVGLPIGVADQPGHLVAWLDALGVGPAVFVGHDLGGGVLQRLVVRTPERASGLVLADCVAFDNWPVLAVRAARRCAGLVERLSPLAVRALLFTAMRNLGHDDPERRAESLPLHSAPYLVPGGARALAHQLRSLDARDTIAIGPELPRVDVPSRVVWGERDPLGRWSGARLANALRAPFEVIPGARHFTPEDHPHTIAHAVLQVLRAAAPVAPR